MANASGRRVHLLLYPFFLESRGRDQLCRARALLANPASSCCQSALRPYPLHLFRLLSMLNCLWEALFLLPRWMACLLTVCDFPFKGDRSAEPRSSVACNSVLDFSGAAMFVASRRQRETGHRWRQSVLLAKCQTCLSALGGWESCRFIHAMTPFLAQTAPNFQLSTCDGLMPITSSSYLLLLFSRLITPPAATRPLTLPSLVEVESRRALGRPGLTCTTQLQMESDPASFDGLSVAELLDVDSALGAAPHAAVVQSGLDFGFSAAPDYDDTSVSMPQLDGGQPADCNSAGCNGGDGGNGGFGGATQRSMHSHDATAEASGAVLMEATGDQGASTSSSPPPLQPPGRERLGKSRGGGGNPDAAATETGTSLLLNHKRQRQMCRSGSDGGSAARRGARIGSQALHRTHSCQAFQSKHICGAAAAHTSLCAHAQACQRCRH